MNVFIAITLLAGPLVGAGQSADELRGEIDRIHQTLDLPSGGFDVAVFSLGRSDDCRARASVTF